MKRSLLAIAVAGALAVVLAGGAFFALKLTASGASVGPIMMSSYPGNANSGVTGGTTINDCDNVVCPIPLTNGGSTAGGITPFSQVGTVYFTAQNCNSQAAVLVTAPLGPGPASLFMQNGVLKTGLLITPANTPYVGGTGAILSAGITAIAGDFQCSNNEDDDGDTLVNDGCVCNGCLPVEAVCGEASCPDGDGVAPWDTCDDDTDGAINDGCAASGTAEQVAVLDPLNNQYLACGNVGGSPVTGWEGKLGSDWKLLVPTAEIDADVTDGNPCNPVDATTDVEIGDQNDIAVCLTNMPAPSGGPPATNGVAKIQFDVLYSASLNECPNPVCGNAQPCTEDDMPDLNEGSTMGLGVPTVPDIGGGWACNGFGFAEPTCTGGTASIACGTLNGPFPPTGVGISFPIFAVTFTAKAVGIDTLTLANGAVYDQPGAALGSCNPTLLGEPALVCIGAEIDKHIPYTPTPPPPSADLSVVKTDAPDPVIVGANVVYTITVTNNDPLVVDGIPAEDVELVDTLPAAKVYVADSATCTAGTCTEAGNVVTCDLGTIAIGDSVVCTITATATALGVSTNVVDVTTSSPDLNLANNHDTEDTTEVSSGVRMEKSPVLDVLWIMDPALGCVNAAEGKGCLAIEKWVYNADDADSPNDSDLIDEGVGAWEEQIKYDHKILFVEAVPDNTWLESGGRVAICSMTILTENWILTGCVTKDGGAGWGAPGPQGDGLIETIYLTPKSDDLIYRQGFRPTKDNGLITDLVDENCEVADTLGEQIPGTLPGGLTTTCGDAHITLRMLEGDVNLDCKVDCLDDQAIAFRYGTFFGLTLYDEWYDLAPECQSYPCDLGGDTVVDDVCTQCTVGVPDFDIDIKDLQFVFGRNYSTCQVPIPDLQGEPLTPPQNPGE